MKNNFWDWKKILPESWIDLIFGIVMIAGCIELITLMILLLNDEF